MLLFEIHWIGHLTDPMAMICKRCLKSFKTWHDMNNLVWLNRRWVGGWIGDLQESFPNQMILWFCDTLFPVGQLGQCQYKVVTKSRLTVWFSLKEKQPLPQMQRKANQPFWRKDMNGLSQSLYFKINKKMMRFKLFKRY